MIRKSTFFIFATILFHASVVLAAGVSSPPVTCSVVDEAALLKGGKLALAAFKPGPGAEAGDQIDKISNMLLKGIKQSISIHQLPLVITEDEEVDFILDGYIEEYAQSGRFSRLILRQKKAGLSVDGEIWSQASGRKVLVFSSSVTINLKKEKLMDAAYHMGLAIGDFISDSIGKK